jgi:hypothetical protein
MAAPRFISDLAGTLRSALRIGVNKLTNDAGNGNVLTSQTNAGVDAPIASSMVHLNAAAAAGKVTLKSPDALATTVAFVLPSADGAANQALVTDASGNLSFATVATGANAVFSEDTTIVFGSSATTTVKVIPAGATVQKVMVQVDTVFDGGTPVPNLSVGKNGGSASAYMATTDNDLTALGEYEVSCMVEEASGPTTVEITFAAATSPSPSTGAAVVTVWWSVPG